MKVLVPLLLGCLRAEEAVAKAEEMGDELVFCFVLPAEHTRRVSYPKLLFWALCGNWALTHYLGLAKKPAKAVFRYGNVASQLKKVFADEKCGLAVLEGWSLPQQELAAQLNVPTVTIFRTTQFASRPLEGENAPPVAPEKVYGADPLDDYVWDIYSRTNGTTARPTVDFSFMPDDWERAFDSGLGLAVYLQLGFFSDHDFLLNLISRHRDHKIAEPDFDRMLKDFAHRAYVLLRYTSVPTPIRDEPWAKRTSLNEHKIEDWCIRAVLKKLHTSGHLSDEEFVFLVSVLSHHLKLTHDAILSLLEQQQLGYDPIITAHNVLHIAGLLEEHGYVVSDRYARMHGLCQHCDKHYGHCNMERRYAEWASAAGENPNESKLTDF